MSIMDTAWFKQRLKDLSLAQGDVAAAINKERSTGSRIVNGVRRLKLDEVDAVSRLLRVSKEEMLRRAGLEINETTMLALETPNQGFDEGLMLRSIEEVLIYILEEQPKFDPNDTAEQIISLYHQYAERRELLSREPTVTIAGNVIRPEMWRRRPT